MIGGLKNIRRNKMTAQEYLNTKIRMCNTYKRCVNCPFNKDDWYDCDELEMDDPEAAEKIVQEWIDANPVITNENKFFQTFGFYPYNDYYDFSKKIFSHIPHKAILNHDWWTKEYKEVEFI
jgi:hypothetical protein